MKLNLGSGFRKQLGYINIDNRQECFPDLIFDLTKGLPYPDNSCSEIRAYDFLEHLTPDQALFMIDEVYRVLRPNGKFESFTPSTTGNGAFMDLHHRSFWNRASWMYFCNDEYRKLYGTKAKFRGEAEDVISDTNLNIIHTRVVIYAIK